jgi:hypothetical protein
MLAAFNGATAQVGTTPALRYDGIYQTMSYIDTADNDKSYNYLRFYPNGKVISVTSTGTALQVKRWFYLGRPNISTGHFDRSGARLYFTTTEDNGTVVYDGTITDQYHLELSAKSLINGRTDMKIFFFIKMPGLR